MYWNNFFAALILGSLRMPHHEVRSLVLSVDDERMTEQILQQLVKYLPGKEEVGVKCAALKLMTCAYHVTITWLSPVYYMHNGLCLMFFQMLQLMGFRDKINDLSDAEQVRTTLLSLETQQSVPSLWNEATLMCVCVCV